MPRGGPPTYTYTLPPVYLAIPGTTILATQHNTPLEDIEDTFNTEWPGYLIQWIVPTADVLSLPDGAVGAPSLTFTNDTDTGIYRVGANDMGLVAGGTKIIDVLSTGATVTGILGVTGTFTATNTAAGTIATLTSTDAGATAGPNILFDRFSASPADADILGQDVFRGRDSAAAAVDYAAIGGVILDRSTANGTAGKLSLLVKPYNSTTLDEIVSLTAAFNPGAPAQANAQITADTTIIRSGAKSSGNLTVQGTILINGANAGQITFPATPNPSSNANTLDDYTEATNTPALTFGGGSTGLTYTSRSGLSVKIGRQVTYQVDMVLSAKGSSTGQAIISTNPNNPATNTAVAVVNNGNGTMTGLTAGMVALSAVGGTSFNFRPFSTTGTGTVITDTAFGNTSEIHFNATYQA